MTARPTPAPLRATPMTDAYRQLHGENAEDAYALAEQLERELQDATAAATGAKELQQDKERLDFLQGWLKNMDSSLRGTWLRIGDNGRLQIHRVHPDQHHGWVALVWDEDECLVDSIPDQKTNNLREAIDIARHQRTATSAGELAELREKYRSREISNECVDAASQEREDNLKADLVRVRSALGTEETGDNLIEVCRAAHQAEQDLARYHRLSVGSNGAGEKTL